MELHLVEGYEDPEVDRVVLSLHSRTWPLS